MAVSYNTKNDMGNMDEFLKHWWAKKIRYKECMHCVWLHLYEVQEQEKHSISGRNNCGITRFLFVCLPMGLTGERNM